MKKILQLCIIIILLHDSICHVSYQPGQVHISENVSEIVITWSTINATLNSIVEYGINGMVLTANGTSNKFVDGGSEKYTQYIHQVKLTNLQPSSKYGRFWYLIFKRCILKLLFLVYHCGSELGWSPQFWFKTVPFGNDWSPHVAIYGDYANISLYF